MGKLSLKTNVIACSLRLSDWIHYHI